MNLYVLKQTSGTTGDAVTDFLEATGSRTAEAPRCPVCRDYVGMRPLVPPIRVDIEAWGREWGDLAFGVGDQILVSERFRLAFVERELRGIARFDPATIVSVRTHHPGLTSPPAYFLATIRRGNAAVDDIASGLVREPQSDCPSCRAGLIKRVSRIVLEAGTYLREDLFFARGLPGIILATESILTLCKDQNLRNCICIPAADFSFDFYPDEPRQYHH